MPLLLAARDEEPCSSLIATARNGGSLIDLDTISRQTLSADLAAYVTKLLQQPDAEMADPGSLGTVSAVDDTPTGHGQRSC
ncbi:hypothetical protein ACFQ60_02900 [Streptomyces zhihengii]